MAVERLWIAVRISSEAVPKSDDLNLLRVTASMMKPYAKNNEVEAIDSVTV